MNPFWSREARALSPYVPGEQPRIANLVKLNTNESPFGPSPRALQAMQAAAADALRLYPDPEARDLCEALAAHHGVRRDQVFVGNGSDEVLAHAFLALLKQPKPLLFPDVTYSFYPVWAQLFGLVFETVPLDDGMRLRVEDYRREAGSIVIANPNAPTGIALPRAEVARLLGEHPDIPVLVDEAYVDFGGESAVPLIADHPNLLVVQTMSKSRALAGLRVGYALGGVGLIEALHRVKNSFNFNPLGRPRPGGRDGFGSRRRLLPRELREGRRRTRSDDAGADPAWFCRSAFELEFRLRQASGAGRTGIRGGVARTCGAGAALQQAAHGALSAYHRRDGGRRATANRGGGAYPRA
jgi:histidinol-phosphate aminotransferase